MKDTENEHLVNEMVLRTQAQARYSNENLGHFGLNLQRYAHFTSPIRRYSDLIVHRALIRALNLGPDGATDQDMVRLEEQAEHVTMTERRSMAAEREATDRYLAIFMADRIGAMFDARIAGVTRAGLFVRLAENGADGFIPAARLSEEYWIHDEAHAALVAQRSGMRYEMGMEVAGETDGGDAADRRAAVLDAVAAASAPPRPQACPSGSHAASAAIRPASGPAMAADVRRISGTRQGTRARQATARTRNARADDQAVRP